MRLLILLSAALLLGQSSPIHAQEKDKPAEPPVEVEIDVTDAPDATAWGEKAKGVVQTWYPKVAAMLATEGYTPAKKIKLVFKKSVRVPAFASGNTITISNDWITKHPDDLGMVVHELTHVIQHYPRSKVNNGWVVEGLADYIRFFKYEPGPSIGRFNPDKAKYTDSYRTTARFLAWIEKTHDKAIVAKLNEACRLGKYKPEIFKDATGKTVDELWDEFIADAKKDRAKPKTEKGKA